MSALPDSRLRVVARVRGVRERDSRVGLVEALAEERAAHARVATLLDRLAGVGAHESGDLVAFLARQRTVDAVAGALAEARARATTCHDVALAARERWRTERSRLAAVESLLGRRAAARAADQRRREHRELDAVAERQWLRLREAGA